MSDKLERVKGEMGLLEKIVSYIPGYRGYKEKELRRETDRIVRMEVSSRLKKAKTEIRMQLSNPDVAMKIAESAGDMQLFDNLIFKLDRAAEKIEKAVAGYAGFFDAVKVREDRLDKVMEHDAMLIERAEAILNKARELRKLKPGSDEWRNALMDLAAMVDEFDSLIDERTEILKTV